MLKRLTLIGAVFLALSSVAIAQVSFVAPITPVGGFCQFTPSAATLLSAQCTTTNAKYAYICVSAIAYYRDDGTTVVGTVGIPIAANTCIWYAGNPNGPLSIISAAGTVSVALYK
jgi:hypothetical protein